MTTEILTGARATVIALNMLGFSLGRALGALISTFIYERWGFPAVTLVAMLFELCAALALAEMQQKVVILPRLLALFRRTPRAD